MLHSGFGKRQGSGGSAAGQGRVGGTPLGPPPAPAESCKFGASCTKVWGCSGQSEAELLATQRWVFCFQLFRKKYIYILKNGGKKNRRGPGEHGSTAL